MARQISGLAYQPSWILSRAPKVTYTADFQYIENGRTVVEDVKGVLTEASRIRMAWLKQLHGVEVTLVRDGRRK